MVVSNTLVGFEILCDGTYKLNINIHFDKSLLTLHHNIGTKYIVINENSSILWHNQFCHIYRERLVKDEILLNLDFTHFGVWIVLRKNNVLQEMEDFLKLSIQTHLLWAEKGILLFVLITFQVTAIFICCMINLKQYGCLRSIHH